MAQSRQLSLSISTNQIREFGSSNSFMCNLVPRVRWETLGTRLLNVIQGQSLPTLQPYFISSWLIYSFSHACGRILREPENSFILETKVRVRLNPWRKTEYINNSFNLARKYMFRWYLSADISCSEKRTVFFELSSRKTAILRLSVGNVSLSFGDEIFAKKYGEVTDNYPRFQW